METVQEIEIYDRVIFVGIDILNDFSPNGSLPVAEGDQVVGPANVVARWVREEDGKVIEVKESHPEDTNHFNTHGGPWPVHGVEGTWGAEFIDGLEVFEEDIVLKKGAKKDEDAYSGYFGIGPDGREFASYVEPYERGESVALFIGGLATDYCVKATVLDAIEQAKRVEADGRGRKLGVFVIQDAIRPVNINPDDGEKAIEEMKSAGARFVTSKEVINGQFVVVRK